MTLGGCALITRRFVVEARSLRSVRKIGLCLFSPPGTRGDLHDDVTGGRLSARKVDSPALVGQHNYPGRPAPGGASGAATSRSEALRGSAAPAPGRAGPARARPASGPRSPSRAPPGRRRSAARACRRRWCAAPCARASPPRRRGRPGTRADRETTLPTVRCTRPARSSSKSLSTTRSSSPRIARACRAVSRLTMSLLVTEITAMAPLMPACCSVFSSQESPITTGSR